MYRLGLWLGLGFVWGLRLHISLIYEFIYIYIGFKHYIYIAVNPKRYTGIHRYPKYIVPLAKPVQLPVRYWHPWIFTIVTWLGIFTNISHVDYKLTVKNLNLKDQYSKILESNYHNKWVKPLRHNLKQKPKIQKK